MTGTQKITLTLALPAGTAALRRADEIHLASVSARTATATLSAVAPKGEQGVQIEAPTRVDSGRPFAYLQYSWGVMRLDYTSYPPVKTYAVNPVQWANRASLTFSSSK